MGIGGRKSALHEIGRKLNVSACEAAFELCYLALCALADLHFTLDSAPAQVFGTTSTRTQQLSARRKKQAHQMCIQFELAWMLYLVSMAKVCTTWACILPLAVALSTASAVKLVSLVCILDCLITAHICWRKVTLRLALSRRLDYHNQHLTGAGSRTKRRQHLCRRAGALRRSVSRQHACTRAAHLGTSCGMHRMSGCSQHWHAHMCTDVP